MENTVLPYAQEAGSKKEQVAKMFDTISPKYDFLNHTLSVGIDVWWRRKAIKFLKKFQPKYILDVATGTADFALQASELKPNAIVGIDISEGMLGIGRQKIAKLGKAALIRLEYGDSEQIHYPDATFDAVIVAFGVRNFENLEKGLQEIARVLQPEKPLVILEFSKPKMFPVKQLYTFYFNFALPKIGKWISKDKSAYTYLPKSVAVFPEGKAFTDILEKNGFKACQAIPLTFGICTMYTALRK